LYVHNPGDRSVPVELPPEISCRLEANGKRMTVAATATPESPRGILSVGPSGFLRATYGFVVPPGVAGPARLSAETFSGAGALFLVEAAPAAEAATARGEEPAEKAEPYPSLDALYSLYQPYLANISAYRPIYFLVGTDPAKSAFQVSFKYRLLNPSGSISHAYPWAQGLHLAYTQSSFWDLQSSSLPFEDTSYKPELFFQTPNLSARPAWMRGWFWKLGFQHESNGQGGDRSRSTNFLYAQPVFIFYDPGTRLGLGIAPKFWAYVANDEETNPDLADYRGYFELEAKVGRAETVVLGTTFRWAREGASVQADLTYPIHRVLFGNLDLYLQLQYVNALAESLLNYSERTQALRLGVSIVR
jgi:outer membrane phospholipase A